jgi:hypothetical protein
VFAACAALAITVATIAVGVRVCGEANVHGDVIVLFHNVCHRGFDRWGHRSSGNNLLIVAVVDTDVVALFAALGSVVLANLLVSAALDFRNRRRHRRSDGRRNRRSDRRRNRRSDGRRNRGSHRRRNRNSWNDIGGRRRDRRRNRRRDRRTDRRRHRGTDRGRNRRRNRNRNRHRRSHWNGWDNVRSWCWYRRRDWYRDRNRHRNGHGDWSRYRDRNRHRDGDDFAFAIAVELVTNLGTDAAFVFAGRAILETSRMRSVGGRFRGASLVAAVVEST